ncbi:MAG: hypothetical protein ACRDD1_13735, partial [Planctomycetia bacterium]
MLPLLLQFLLIATAAPAEPSAAPERGQEELTARYREFETALQRAADVLKTTDADRAALLLLVLSRSRNGLVAGEMTELTAKLKAGEWTDAIKGQESVRGELVELMKLLTSEDEARRRSEQRERLEKYLAEVKTLRDDQKRLRARTERADARVDPTPAKNKQNDLADRAKKLTDALGKEESKGADGGANAGKSGDGSSGDAAGGPGRKNLEAARRAMEAARDQLEKKRTEKASAEQDEAVRELEKAVAELEEILRQMREAERQQLLSSLESRFRKMLEVQKIVLESSTRLDGTPKEKRTRVDVQKAAALAPREKEIVAEGERTLLLLQEDGTAIVFPEAVLQVRDDASLIAALLAEGDVSALTRRLEADVVALLEEMIAAVQKERRESQGKSSGEGGGGDGPSPLLERIAELKMIRSMQQRVFERTERLAR